MINSFIILAVCLLGWACSGSAQPQCGIKGNSPLVVGGRETVPGEIPWQVGLLDITGHALSAGKKEKALFCGGTLIAEKWVLTAAHCFDIGNGRMNRNPKFKEVRVGSWHRGEKDATERDIKIEKIVTFPEYTVSRWTVTGDIALVQLKNPVDLTSFAAGTACLPKEDQDYRGHKDCILSGYGLAGFDADGERIIPATMRLTVGQVWLQSALKKAWNPFFGIIKIIRDTHIGFGMTAGRSHGACNGDSGGPLVCPDEAGFLTVVGVVSFGPPNCQKKPSVLTDVSKYTDWIHETMRT